MLVNEDHILTKSHVAKLVAGKLQTNVQPHHITNCNFSVNPGASGAPPKLCARGGGKLSGHCEKVRTEFYFDVRVGLYSDDVGIHLDLDEAVIEANWEGPSLNSEAEKLVDLVGEALGVDTGTVSEGKWKAATEAALDKLKEITNGI